MSTESPTQEPKPATEQLTPERIHQLTHTVADQLRLNPTDARLLKFTNNAVILLPRAHAVLRIAGSSTVRARVPGVIAAAHWYAAHDIPAVRLWPDVQHPIQVGPHLITLWQETPATGPDPTPADLGTLLRAIHAVRETRPPEIPPWRIVQGMKQRLQHAEAIDPQALTFLTTEVAEIEESISHLRAIPPLIPPGVIHGDAHLGNIIASPDGPVICDFDSTSMGRQVRR